MEARAHHDIAFTLNRAEICATVAIDTTAFDLIRNQFGLTSVRSACDGIGMCGACTILVDGLSTASCLLLAIDLDAKNVETVESLMSEEILHPLQQAFVDKGAIQCGYCTAGMLLAAKALLNECSKPSREQIRRGLSGNLCRCTGYTKIVDAIESVSDGDRL